MKPIFLRWLVAGCFLLAVFFGIRAFFYADVIMTWYDVTGSAPAFSAQGTVQFTDPSGLPKASFEVEIAENAVTRELGLMFRPKMEANHGMVFLFEEEQMRAFWMKNTRIPLDILFLSADSTIVTIREAERLFSTKPVASSAPAKFVVELNLGTSKKLNLRVGDRLQLRRYD